jgi:hypothetical protein
MVNIIFACCSTFFSKMTESDHKKAYQEYLKEKTFRTVVIHFAIKINMFLSNMRSLYNVAMCCQSLATLGCMHILMYNIFVHQSGGLVR